MTNDRWDTRHHKTGTGGGCDSRGEPTAPLTMRRWAWADPRRRPWETWPENAGVERRASTSPDGWRRQLVPLLRDVVVGIARTERRAYASRTGRKSWPCGAPALSSRNGRDTFASSDHSLWRASRLRKSASIRTWQALRPARLPEHLARGDMSLVCVLEPTHERGET